MYQLQYIVKHYKHIKKKKKNETVFVQQQFLTFTIVCHVHLDATLSEFSAWLHENSKVR